MPNQLKNSSHLHHHQSICMLVGGYFKTNALVVMGLQLLELRKRQTYSL